MNIAMILKLLFNVLSLNHHSFCDCEYENVNRDVAISSLN